MSAADAAKRLGAPIEHCHVCGSWFSLHRTPRHWMHVYVDNELCDIDEGKDGEHDLFCSKVCAEKYIKLKNDFLSENAYQSTTYVYYEDIYEEPPDLEPR